MALKDTWVDKVDGVDDVVAATTNEIAHAVIELENDEIIVQTTGDSTTEVMSQKATTVEINALKSNLSDKLPKSPLVWEPWTTEEQATARERMGVVPLRQTIVIDTPVWETQPTIEGTLNEAFKTWESRPYYVTLKNTDGTALAEGQFKLCETLDGYASAIDQIFTASGISLTENKAVDFKAISSDRTTFEMRDAGVSGISITTQNSKSQRFIISVEQSLIRVQPDANIYLYLRDAAGQSLGANADYYSPVGKYNGYNGFLFTLVQTNLVKLGYRIEANRTKKGFVTNLIGLASNKNNISQQGFSDFSKSVDDFQQYDLSRFTLNSNNYFYFGNGTSITLEEFA